MISGMRTLLVLGTFVLAAGPVRAQRRPITAEEIERARSTVSSAFDAVERLRPRWLQAPREVVELGGSNSDVRLARLHVYQDDRDMGSVDYLKTIPAERVFTISWLSMTEAGVRFGPSEGPVLVVKMKPAGPN